MRVKRGVKARRRRNSIMALAKGFRGRSKNTIRQTTQRVEKALTYAYRDRRARKREFRRLWVTRVGAAARVCGLSYSRFMHGLSLSNVELDRKVLADLGARRPDVFAEVASVVKSTLEARS